MCFFHMAKDALNPLQQYTESIYAIHTQGPHGPDVEFAAKNNMCCYLGIFWL